MPSAPPHPRAQRDRRGVLQLDALVRLEERHRGRRRAARPVDHEAGGIVAASRSSRARGPGPRRVAAARGPRDLPPTSCAPGRSRRRPCAARGRAPCRARAGAAPSGARTSPRAGRRAAGRGGDGTRARVEHAVAAQAGHEGLQDGAAERRHGVGDRPHGAAPPLGAGGVGAAGRAGSRRRAPRAAPGTPTPPARRRPPRRAARRRPRSPARAARRARSRPPRRAATTRGSHGAAASAGSPATNATGTRLSTVNDDGVLAVEARAAEAVPGHLPEQPAVGRAGLVRDGQPIARPRDEARLLHARVELHVLAGVERGVERPHALEDLAAVHRAAAHGAHLAARRRGRSPTRCCGRTATCARRRSRARRARRPVGTSGCGRARQSAPVRSKRSTMSASNVGLGTRQWPSTYATNRPRAAAAPIARAADESRRGLSSQRTRPSRAATASTRARVSSVERPSTTRISIRSGENALRRGGPAGRPRCACPRCGPAAPP